MTVLRASRSKPRSYNSLPSECRSPWMLRPGFTFFFVANSVASLWIIGLCPAVAAIQILVVVGSLVGLVHVVGRSISLCHAKKKRPIHMSVSPRQPDPLLLSA